MKTGRVWHHKENQGCEKMERIIPKREPRTRENNQILKMNDTDKHGLAFISVWNISSILDFFLLDLILYYTQNTCVCYKCNEGALRLENKKKN